MGEERVGGAGGKGLSRRELLRAGAGLALAPGLLAGCGGSGADVPPPPRSRRIGLSLAGGTPFDRCLATGAYAALHGSGYTLVAREAGQAAAREADNITALLEQKVAGLIVQPASVGSATRAAQLAQQGGVRAIACLSPGPGAGSRFFAGAVEVPGSEGGRLIGQWLKANVPRGGQIVVVQGLLGQGLSEGLDAGLDAALAGDRRFEVVTRGPGNLDGRDAVAVIGEAFALHPRARIVVDYGAAMGDAISAYLSARGRPDVVHVTSDGDDATLRWLRTPYLRATRYFSAAQAGRTAARMALKAVRQGDVALKPFTATVPQSMRTARDIGRAQPACVPAFAARAARI
jgi:ABC-type sugar transport system substrate-binding protein